MRGIIFLAVLLVLISSVYSSGVCDICDSDRDEVIEEDDFCTGSDTVVVDVFGCSCEQKINCESEWCCGAGQICGGYRFRAVCMRDSDGDGTGDLEDNCVNVPNEDQDDGDGDGVGDECDINDGDGDGVVDEEDSCDNTPTGEEVDGSGCACSQLDCDDGNDCTDDLCGNAECFYVEDDENDCGEGKECADGVCIPDGLKGNLNPKNPLFRYDPETGGLLIVYTHSVHTIAVVFEEPVEENVSVGSTSNLLREEWNAARTELRLVVEGDPGKQGITYVNSRQRPSKVIMDNEELPDFDGMLSPSGNGRIYLYSFLVAAALFFFVVFLVVGRGRLSKPEADASFLLRREMVLRNYIVAHLRKGHLAAHIRDWLLRQGWESEVVDDVFRKIIR